MYKDKKVGVVIPAYNEERLVGRVIETLPSFVDCIIVVDDASQDRTKEIVNSYLPQLEGRLILICHEQNQGVGGAIVSGHYRALAEGMDVIAVMAGDAQMDPAELNRVLEPVVEGQADYAKGNRFASGEAWQAMPKIRFFANAALSMLNKIASGYWHVADPQCGYTAISRYALERLDLDRISKGYQFENSMLTHLNLYDLRVIDVPVKPLYGIGEKSGFSNWWALGAFSVYLVYTFVGRLWAKYVIRDFHPLVLFYFFGFLFLLFGLILGIYFSSFDKN